MIKYGLKIWSSNINLFNEVGFLLDKGMFDFMEIYTVPGKIDFTLFEKLPGKQVFLHAPHFGHQFNIFNFGKLEKDFFHQQIFPLADFLRAKYIVVHAGEGEDPAIFQKNISLIADSRILIENEPQSGLAEEKCFGYSQEQLLFIKEKCGFNLCFDFGHAIKSAFSQGIDYKDFISKIIAELNPFYFHLCGAHTKGEAEKHLNLFEGDADIKWIKSVLAKQAKNQDIYLVLETPKIGKDLSNDLKNLAYFISIPPSGKTTGRF